MTTRLTAAATILTASVLSGSIALTSQQEPPPQLIVHEWGTFTSVAGEDGKAIHWLPLDGPPDLPCFVDRARGIPPKTALPATVRMETPVLYFYAPEEMTVDVDVRFQQGLITEYFPSARVDADKAAWTRVRVVPRGPLDFPVEEASSHYYAARRTDASPLHVNGEAERFLFYRGVGKFPLPVSATIGLDEEVEVANLGDAGIESVILFENRDGRIGYRIQDVITGSARLARPRLDADPAALQADLERILTSNGLFAKEAAAMVDTWRDSWFEEGSRVFYIVPQQTVRTMLPLRISPRPSETVRVFVGRLELVTPTTMRDVREATAAGDSAALGRYGRFLLPIGNRLLTPEMPAAERALIQQRLQEASASYNRQLSACQE